MNKLIIAIIGIILMLPSVLWAACVADGDNWTSTPDYSSVSSCISSAKAGDTVSVTAGDGSETWSSALTITKGINLIGPGASNLTITGAVGSTKFMIVYDPSAPANNDPFRLSGFSFDCDNNSKWLNLRNSSATKAQTKIRIDNNKVNNMVSAGLRIDGHVYGVIDSNTLSGDTHTDNYANDTCADWSGSAPAFSFGNADNMYYEDNIIALADTAVTCGHGGRYVYRYNTFNASVGLYPWFDVHGNQTTVVGSRGVEIYGNTVNNNGKGMKAFDHRGGQALIFYNKGTRESPTAYARDEFNNSVPTSCGGAYDFRVQNSYYWNNRGSSSLITFVESDAVNGIAENVNYWNHNVGFNGTTGMGCGTLANRPGTCTVGVGYWIPTDITTMPCSSVSADNVGKSPKTPISGTLYKCTATNTWTAYYVPYTYPHPLRGEADAVAPTRVSASIDETGLILTTTHSETMVATITTGLALTCTGGAITATYSATNGAIITHSLNRVVNQGEVCTATYTQPGNGYEDVAGNDLATYTDQAIVNGSTVQSETTYELSITVVGGGTVNSSQGGIQCTAANSPCTKTCDSGTVITFTPIQYNGWNTGSWSGTGCGASTTISEARNCTYTFTEIKLLPW